MVVSKLLSQRGPPYLTTVAEIFILLSFGLEAAGQKNSSAAPLILPIFNTTLSDGLAVNRGLQLELGGQILGLRPSLVENNTRVRNAADCSTDPVNRTICLGASGGVYSISAGTFIQEPQDQWNVTVVDPHPVGSTLVYGYDSADLASTPSVVIKQLPVEVWSNVDALNKSEVALGPSSSFISRLVDGGLAPCAAFGLYYGSRSQNYGQDGQFIIGGIDNARIQNTAWTEFPIVDLGAPIDCPLQVMLEDVILGNVNGNHSLFSDPGARVPACVDTIQNAFTFTKIMFNTWASLTNHIDYDGSNYSAQTYPLDREPLIGNLTIKLAGGYTSFIPHYELVSNERGNDAQGKYAVTNTSRVMAAVEQGVSDLGVDVPILGGTFLSQNYLRVDWDAKKFWLANAVTTPTVKSQISNICAASSSSATASMSPTSSSDGSSSDSTLLVKALVPSLVGGALVFGLIGLGLFLYFRRPHRVSTWHKQHVTELVSCENPSSPDTRPGSRPMNGNHTIEPDSGQGVSSDPSSPRMRSGSRPMTGNHTTEPDSERDVSSERPEYDGETATYTSAASRHRPRMNSGGGEDVPVSPVYSEESLA